MQRWPAQPKRTYLASQPRPDGEREIPRAHAEREVLRRSQPREKRQAQRCDQDLAQRQQCQASHEAGDLVGQVAVPCMTLASVGAAFSRRRNRSVVLSLLPRWHRVCPSGRPLFESLSSLVRSACEAWVRQRPRAWVRQWSRAWVRQRSRTTRSAPERRELTAESRRRPLAASVGAPTVAGVGAPTVTSVGAPTVAPRSLSRNPNAGPTAANARQRSHLRSERCQHPHCR